MSGHRSDRTVGHHSTVRDRRGRGMRLPLLPPQAPGFRTRTQLFDEIVMDAVADVERRWPDQAGTIEFAVDEVPLVSAGAVDDTTDVVLDGGVPLARFFAAGIDKRGRATRSRLVIYRRPVAMRAAGHTELVELVTEVLVEQLTAVLGEGDSDDGPPDRRRS